MVDGRVAVEQVLAAGSDYYRVLGVAQDASIQEIRQAYIKAGAASAI